MMSTYTEVAETIKLGNPNEFTIRQLAELVIELTGSAYKLAFMRLSVDDPTQRQPDISLARDKLGSEPNVQLKQGLIQTITYFDQLLNRDSV